jgi:hypothetical protein
LACSSNITNHISENLTCKPLRRINSETLTNFQLPNSSHEAKEQQLSYHIFPTNDLACMLKSVQALYCWITSLNHYKYTYTQLKQSSNIIQIRREN